MEKLSRPTNLKPETVGSFIWGCSQNYYGSVDKNCSLLCTNGLFSDNVNSCKYKTFLYENNKLTEYKNITDNITTTTNPKLNIKVLNPKQNKAYVYISDDFTGFNTSDIETLKNYNISEVCLLNTDNNVHNNKNGFVKLENLPITQNVKIKTESPSFLAYLVVILIFLIILYLIYIKMKKKI